MSTITLPTRHCFGCEEHHDLMGFNAPRLHLAGIRVRMTHAHGAFTEFRVGDFQAGRNVPVGNVVGTDYDWLRVVRLDRPSSQSVPIPLLTVVPESVTEERTGGALPDPCSSCGWQYDLERVLMVLVGEATIDMNPTHRCVR